MFQQNDGREATQALQPGRARRRFVAVIGGHGHNTAPEAVALAEAFGLALARRQFNLVCGGGDGVMEAACRGCRSGGGLTVGILKFNSPDDANAHVDIAVPTSMDVASNNIIVWMADAVLAFQGRYGTLNEMALALDFGKPLIVLGPSPLLASENIRSDVFLHVPDATSGDIETILQRMEQMIMDSSFDKRSGGS